MNEILDTLITPFRYGFVHQALLVVSIVAITAGLLSCWLVLVGWSLLGDAISHAVLPGVVVAFILGLPFAVGALAAALLAVGLVHLVGTKTTLREDTGIGVVFTTFFAAGLVLISVTPASGHVLEILFGNLLGISHSAMVQVLVCGALALVIVVGSRRALTLWAFDPLHAATIGFPAPVIRFLLLASMALVVVAGVQAVGVILVVSLLITPGAVAYLLTTSFRKMLIIAPLVAWVSGVGGILLSFYVDISSGGTIVSVQSTIFALVFLFGRREGVAVRAFRRVRAGKTNVKNSPVHC